MTTEIGRQPYTVYGVLRTADSISPIALPGIATSLVIFVVIYFIVFGAGVMVILRMMAKPPTVAEPGLDPEKPIRLAGIHRPARRRVGGHGAPICAAGGVIIMSTETVATIWASLLAFAVLAYVVLDGFDLGVGLLFAAERAKQDRDTMVNSIAPMWDGNETWLVPGGGGLFGVFPLAYSIIMPALYPVIFGMLFGLIFRGVAFELRFRAETLIGQRLWDMSFFAGSLGAALCQGLPLGGLVQGIHVVDRHYAGSWFDWLTPFTLLCGVAVVFGYAWLGACWLVWLTDEQLQQRARKQAAFLGWVMLGLISAVSIWTPFLNPIFMARWFDWPGITLTSPVPILVAFAAAGYAYGIRSEYHLTPFLCALAIFVLCFAGLGISFYPLMVPPGITIWQAAAPRSSQLFVLAGACILIPCILCYASLSYWVFRGKVQADAHYR